MLIYDKKTGTVLDARHCVFIDTEAEDYCGNDLTPEEWVTASEDCVPVVSGYNCYTFLIELIPDLILSATRDTGGNVLDHYDI